MSIEDELGEALELTHRKQRYTAEDYKKAAQIVNRYGGAAPESCGSCGSSIARWVIKMITKHVPKVPIEQFNTRISICNDCPLFDKKTYRCTECTCWMDYKAHWLNQKCPVDKW